jgi:hypothetical protein
MSHRAEYETAISEFLRRKSVIRCPTACAAPTYGTIGESDRTALRNHEEAQEAARVQKLATLPKRK